MLKRTATIVMVLFLFIAAGVGGYYWHSVTPPPLHPQYPGPVEKLTIGNLRSEMSALLWIGQENGYFRENGLEVNLKLYDAVRFAIDDVLAGKIDLAGCSEFVFIGRLFSGDENLRCLGAIATADIYEVLARKDRGITRPQDLKGKKIGVTLQTAGEFFLGTFLTLNGLTPKEVEIVDLSSLNINAALAAGKVDAILTWGPNVSEIKTRLGDKVMAWPGQSGQKFYWLLVGADQAINARSAALVRLFQALRRAEDFVEKNPEAAKAMVAQRLQFSPSYINHLWPQNKYALSLDQPLLLAMEDEARWMLKNRPTERTEGPNYLNYLYVEALQQAAPDAVKIVGMGSGK